MRPRLSVALKLLLGPAFAGLLAASCGEEPMPAPMTPPAAPAAAPAPAPAPAKPAEAKLPEAVTPDAAFRQQPPAAGAMPEFKVPAVKRFKLKNGLQVVLAEAHDLPLIDMNLIIKAGGAANPKNMPGLADMAANMLDEGTKTRNAIQIAEDLAQIGASLGTGASWDSSGVTVGALSRTFDQALQIWTDVLLNPSFDEKEFTRVRDNQLTGMTRRKDSPPAVAGMTFAHALYGDDHPFAWPANGTEDSVKKMTVADLKKFYESYYRPNNAVLIVAGDITEAALKSKLETALKAWKPKKVSLPKVPKAVPLGKTKIFMVDKPGAPQSSIRVGLVAISRTDPDYFAASLMNLILGGSFMRLDMNLRETKAWTYGARSGLDMRKTPGPFSAGGEFVASPDNNHTTDSVKEILDEIRKMRDQDVTDDELKRAKDMVVKSFPARFATRGGIAGQMAELALFDLPPTYWDDYSKKLNAVSKAEVRKVAQKLLQTDKLAIVVVGDQKRNEEPLKKIAEVEIRDLEGRAMGAGGAKAAATEGKDAKPAAAKKN